jgi:hypothetical protein
MLVIIMDDKVIENRGVASESEALQILGNHLPILWECLHDAWTWVQQMLTWDDDARQTLSRSRASIMNERATRLIEQRFSTLPGVRVARHRGFLQVFFQERGLLPEIRSGGYESLLRPVQDDCV